MRESVEDLLFQNIGIPKTLFLPVWAGIILMVSGRMDSSPKREDFAWLNSSQYNDIESWNTQK